MPEVPDVSAIVEQVKARIKQIEAELARHERLSDELARLRDALGRLEGAARSQVGRRRRGGQAAAPPAARAPCLARPATSASRRAPRGQNKAKVLEALKRGPMTASEISKTTGIATGTASTLLTTSPRAARSLRPNAATSCRTSRRGPSRHGTALSRESRRSSNKPTERMPARRVPESRDSDSAAVGRSAVIAAAQMHGKAAARSSLPLSRMQQRCRLSWRAGGRLVLVQSSHVPGSPAL